ncbi:MAG: hypothetical protein M0T73_16515 [Deltaproteobacteria bacterium]|nr:hypothetical protein [Deltaproteobacteria bacterium]
MTIEGLFTESDRSIVERAARLAEGLVLRYFNLASDDWVKNPYCLLTWKEASGCLRDTNVFAQTVRLGPRKRGKPQQSVHNPNHYGILLQDPAILRALLRPQRHDLWTLGLFVLTHELVHIVRFRKFAVDFCGAQHEREKEEELVHEITKEMLGGVENMDNLFSLYESGPTI